MTDAEQKEELVLLRAVCRHALAYMMEAPPRRDAAGVKHEASLIADLNAYTRWKARPESARWVA